MVVFTNFEKLIKVIERQCQSFVHSPQPHIFSRSLPQCPFQNFYPFPTTAWNFWTKKKKKKCFLGLAEAVILSVVWTEWSREEGSNGREIRSLCYESSSHVGFLFLVLNNWCQTRPSWFLNFFHCFCFSLTTHLSHCSQNGSSIPRFCVLFSSFLSFSFSVACFLDFMNFLIWVL